MIINIILLIIGFILLIKSADFFVDGASSVAQNFKISKMLIGLTIIAFGTGAPELAISMNALANHNTDIVLGNVIGSCILNSLLILGIAAIINPIIIKDNTVKKELPLCLLISVLLVTLFLDININNASINQISRSDAIVILLFFTIFIYYLITIAKQKKEHHDKPAFKLSKSFILVILGLLGIIVGSDIVIASIEKISLQLGLSHRIISLTVVAFGTSLPELVTTITASYKKEQDLLLGNIIGSNIFNICIVLGLPVAIYGSITPASFKVIDLLFLLISSTLLFIFSTSKRRISRLEGYLLLATFIIYYLLVFIS